MSRLLRIAYLGIPALILALSLAIMLSGPFLKRPRHPGEDVAALIDRVGGHAGAGQWAQANKAAEQLTAAWDGVEPRVRFTSASGVREQFDMALADLQSAVEAEDADQVRVLHRRLLHLWGQVGASG
jgi:hypothetical protein